MLATRQSEFKFANMTLTAPTVSVNEGAVAWMNVLSMKCYFGVRNSGCVVLS